MHWIALWQNSQMEQFSWNCLQVVSIPGSAALEVPFSVEIRANVDPERFRQGLQLSCKAGGCQSTYSSLTASLQYSFLVFVVDFAEDSRAFLTPSVKVMPCNTESDGGKVMRLGPSTISIEEDSCETTMDFVAFERGVQKLPEIFLGHTGASVAMDALNLSIWIE